MTSQDYDQAIEKCRNCGASPSEYFGDLGFCGDRCIRAWLDDNADEIQEALYGN